MLPPEHIDPALRGSRRRQGVVNLHDSWLPDFQLTYVVAGSGRLTLAGHRVDLAPDHLICIPPYRRFTLVCPDPSFEMFTALFDLSPTCPGKLAGDRRADRGNGPWRHAYDVRFPRGLRIPQHLVFAHGSVLGRLFQELVTQFSSTGLLSRLHAKVLLQRIILLIMDRNLLDSGDPAPLGLAQHKVDQAVAYIETHLANPVAVAGMARAAGLSVSHFIRTFRQWIGQSPMEYVQHRRMEQAKRLLANVDLSIKQVAMQVGFHDPLYFSRLFHRLEGQSASAYRQRLLSSSLDKPIIGRNP